MRWALVVVLALACCGCALDDIEDELRATRKELEQQRLAAQAMPTPPH
jgi:hypothetical protein